MAQTSVQRHDETRLSSLQKQPRRLACRRCSRQKLQCRWEEDEDQTCIRCHRAGAVCTSSTPRRLGRPIQSQKPSASTKKVDDAQPEQQNIGDGISFDFGTSPYIPGIQPILPEWPASTSISVQESNHGSDILHTGGEVAGQSARDELWSSNNSTRTLYSLTTMLDETINVVDIASIPDVELLSPDLPGDPAPSDCPHQLPPNTAGSDVRRFWDLQMSLDVQLTRIRLATGGGTTETSNVCLDSAKPDRAQLPLDDILQSTHTFIDVLRHGSSFGPNEDDAASRPSGAPFAADNHALFTTEACGNVEGACLSTGNAADQGCRRSNLLAGMDTPTLCMVVSCYSRLMDVYDETFKYIREELQGFSLRASTCRLVIPSFQIGNFCLKDGYLLHMIIVVQMLLYLLRYLEKCMGIMGEHGVLRREGTNGAGQSSQAGSEWCSYPGDPPGTGDKINKVIMALEADGPGVLTRSTRSLRSNIEIVQQLLECASL